MKSLRQVVEDVWELLELVETLREETGATKVWIAGGRETGWGSADAIIDFATEPPTLLCSLTGDKVCGELDEDVVRVLFADFLRGAGRVVRFEAEGETLTLKGGEL